MPAEEHKIAGVIITGLAAMVILNGWLAVFIDASVTCTVNPDVPPEVGVPEIVSPERLSPAGRLPEITAQV